MSEKEIRFPLSKKVKAEFVEKYEKIFFKKPVHNISDEKLVELVNANKEKLGSDEKLSNKSSQEGTQDAKNGEGVGSEGNGDAENKEGTGAIGDGKVSPEDERIYQLERFKNLHGIDADENLPTEEISALSTTKENDNFVLAEQEYVATFGRNPNIDFSTEKIWALIGEERERKAEGETLKQRYFDLFGKNHLSEMTKEQVVSAIKNEENRQAIAKEQSKAKVQPTADELEHNAETEMVIVNKKNPNDKRVINKSTFDFLKHDFDPVVKVPEELKTK